MSNMEKEEFTTRIKAMDNEEQKLAAKLLPSEVLWDELCRRYIKMESKLEDILATVHKGCL